MPGLVSNQIFVKTALRPGISELLRFQLFSLLILLTGAFFRFGVALFVGLTFYIGVKMTRSG